MSIASAASHVRGKLPSPVSAAKARFASRLEGRTTLFQCGARALRLPAGRQSKGMVTDDFKDRQKHAAAKRALELVEPGMTLGLGSGSTARHFVDLVGEKVSAGLDIRCVATSEATAAQARALGIRLATLDEIDELDVTIDGADEIDPQLR